MGLDTNFGSSTKAKVMGRDYCIGEPADDNDVVDNDTLENALETAGVTSLYIGKILSIKYGHGQMVKELVDAVDSADFVRARILAETLMVRVGFDPRGENSENTRYFNG